MKGNGNGNRILTAIQRQIPLIDAIKKVDSDPRSLPPASQGAGKFTKSGRNYVGLCPFHREKTGSFRVDYHDGDHSGERYHCFGGQCGVHGGLFDYVVGRMNFQFIDAVQYVGTTWPTVKYLVEEFVSSSPKKPRRKRQEVKFDLDSGERDLVCKVLACAQEHFTAQIRINSNAEAAKAREYAESRGLQRIAEKIGLGYSPANDIVLVELAEKFGMHKDVFDLLRKSGLIGEEGFAIFQRRIMFPIRTHSGTVIGYSGRSTDPKSKRKYKNPSESLVFSKKHVLLGLEYINYEKVRADGLCLVEGVTDIFGFLEQGLNYCLALGSTALTQEHLGIIEFLKPRKITIFPDGDIPGLMGGIKNANRLLSVSERSENGIPVFIALLPDDKDPFDVFFTGREDIRKHLQDAQSSADALLKSLRRVVDAHQENGSTKKALERFLRDNTKHIISDYHLNAALKEYGIEVRGRQPLILETPSPHGFLVQ